LEAFAQRAPDGFFDLLNGEYTLEFVLAFALYHICYIGGNWTFVQRYTSVDSPVSARKVAFLFAGLYLVSPVIWMLPPMLYQVINPGLQGLDTENAYLMVCRLVLPSGLMGLMLTGMYFSTSASANTTLNVVSAVFTNDIYKGLLNPGASDRRLMNVARASSWLFGVGMIIIALLVPAAGGIVEVVLSIGAITGGPLLAPPVWALFSKRLTGRATLLITGISLAVNLIGKIVLPLLLGFKLTRGQEMMLGVTLPLLLLMAYEGWTAWQGRQSSPDYQRYLEARKRTKAAQLLESEEEKEAVRQQNRFGLRVIAFSLVFTAGLLFILSWLTTAGTGLVAGIAALILLLAYIPWRAARHTAVSTPQRTLKVNS
jgi:Na+/proline symporter